MNQWKLDLLVEEIIYLGTTISGLIVLESPKTVNILETNCSTWRQEAQWF